MVPSIPRELMHVIAEHIQLHYGRPISDDLNVGPFYPRVVTVSSAMQDLAIMCRVNKVWLGIARGQLYRNVHIHAVGQVPLLTHTLANKQIACLVRTITFAPINFPSQDYRYVDNCYGRPAQTLFPLLHTVALVFKCPNIVGLYFDHWSIMTEGVRSPMLTITTLRLGNVWEGQWNAVFEFISSFPALETLVIYTASNLDRTDYNQSAVTSARLPPSVKLKNLAINHVVPGSIFLYLLPAAKTLERFHLHSNKQWYNPCKMSNARHGFHQFIEALSSRGRSLSYLSLLGPHAEVVKELLRNCPSIRYLRMSCLTWVPRTDMYNLFQIMHMQSSLEHLVFVPWEDTGVPGTMPCQYLISRLVRSLQSLALGRLKYLAMALPSTMQRSGVKGAVPITELYELRDICRKRGIVLDLPEPVDILDATYLARYVPMRDNWLAM